jgi:hypothetical protein
VQAYFGQRDEYPGRLLIATTRRGYRARAGQRVQQPGRDRALGPLITDSYVRCVANERAEHDREYRQPGGEGHREPGIDQGESDDAADRGNEGRQSQDAASGSAASVRGATNDPADQVPGGKTLRQPEPTGEDVTGQIAPDPLRGGRGADSGGQLAERLAGHDDDNQRDASGQPAVGAADVARRPGGRGRRSQHDVHGVTRDRREKGVSDGPRDRRDGEQGGPVTTSPYHPQQQPIRGAAQHPAVPVAAGPLVVRHACLRT